jgi:hypothetical protein
MPIDKSSSIIASQISWPRKKSRVPFLNSASGRPEKEAPSQYLIATLFQLKNSATKQKKDYLINSY